MGLNRETIITLGAALPPSVSIFGRLETLLARPDTDISEIVDLVRVDPALTFQIIRLGNSVFYGLKNHCDSLEDAVVRIGFGDIHSLVGLVAARQACQQDLLFYQIPARRFWENAVATGQLMAAFAARNGSDVRMAYSTGLLRNLGRLLLNNYNGAVRYPGVSAAPDVQAWEKATYEITAAEAGATLLEYWRFSADTVEAVRTHGNPLAESKPALSALMLHLSAAVADGWGLGLSGERVLWHQDEAMVAQAGLNEDSCRDAMEEAQKIFAKSVAIPWIVTANSAA